MTQNKNIKIAITGGAGFLGSHIVDKFVEEGADIIVIDDFSSGKMDNIRQHIDKKNFKVREANLMLEDAAFDALNDVDMVVHLAAKIGGIGYFHRIPADIIADNDLINRNVFNAGAKFNLDRIIYFSSSMVFERATSFPSTEEHLTKIPPPISAYGFEKLNGEYYCRAYKRQYNLDYTILRPFNAVGPREFPEKEVGKAHVIPDLVDKIIRRQQYPLEILGDGSQERAFTNVKDLAAGCYLAIFSEKAINEDFNLGNPREIKMEDLAKKIWSMAGRKEPISFKYLESFSEDVKKRIPDFKKAKNLLGWEPKKDLDQSLKEYIEWFEKNKQKMME